MTDILQTISELHILLGNVKKADNDTAYHNSLVFADLLKEKEHDYRQFMESVLGEKQNLRNDKVSNYIKQKILVSREGLDLEGKTFVIWVKKSRSFQIIEGKELISKIKQELADIRKRIKKKEKSSEAKNSRVTLLERPTKSLERKTGTSNNAVGTNDISAMTAEMRKKKDQYYGAAWGGAKAILTEIIAGLKSDGYTFIQEVDGAITQLSDDEAQSWIRDLYSKYKDKWTAEKPVEDMKQKHFTEAEDKQIVQFVKNAKVHGIDFKQVNWGMLEMPHRDRESIRRRAKSYLFDDNGEVIQHFNEGKEWTNEADRALFDSFRAGETDVKVLAKTFGRSGKAVKHRLDEVTFDSTGKRLKRADAMKIILSNVSLSKEYLSAAKMKPQEELCERSLQMGCLEHGYKGNEGGYAHGVTTELVGGIKVVGPCLHQAAATVGSGPKPAPTEGTYHRIEASHLCKNATCVNPEHVVWEDNAANIRRKICVGMVRFNIGGKDIFARAKECTCNNGHCLDYITAA